MKKLYTFLLATSALLGNAAFSQTVSFDSAVNDSITGCQNSVIVYTNYGANPETAGVITVNWGDGNTTTHNYTSTPGWQYDYFTFDHTYAAAGTYSATISVYSGAAGGTAGPDRTETLTAYDPENCGYAYISTFRTSPSYYYYDVPYDFTGADGITTTISTNSAYYYNGYSGLNLANVPYTVSINDDWLADNGLTQLTPDFVISAFEPNGAASNSYYNIEVDCSVPATQPNFAVNYGYAWAFVAPLQTGHVSLNICNYACSNSATAAVSLDFPAGMSMVPNTSDLTNASVTGNTLTFDIPNLSDCMYLDIPFTFDGSTPAGTELEFTATVTNPDDTDPSNNSLTIESVVLNSYDPNNKLVDKPEHIDVNTDEKLRYVINFQNEGNFNAVNVVVRDTLSSNLDLSTFRVLGSRHPVATTVDPVTRVVTFSFHNANLWPASVSEEGSKGFITYEIEENTGLALHSEISNTAYIYFDFNPAIVTNTTSNVNSILGLNDPQIAELTMYPNPAVTTVRFSGEDISAVRVIDLTGKEVLASDSPISNELSVSTLSNGIYQVVVTTTKGVETHKLVIKK